MKLRATLILLVVVGLPVQAETAAPDETAVRVYTNADLEKFGPPSESATPDWRNDREPGWEFVESFLEREYARLRAAREQELQRAWIDAEREATRRGHDRYRYSLPYVGYHGGYVRPLHHHPPRSAAGAGTGPASRIVPLHARPTPAQAHRARAIRNSGADAFPSR